MSRCVDDLNFPPAKIQMITVVKNSLRHTLKDLISVNVKIRRKIARKPRQILPDGLQRYRKTDEQPFLFRFVYGDMIKITVSSDVIPMDMRCNDLDRQFRQTVHNIFNMGNP